MRIAVLSITFAIVFATGAAHAARKGNVIRGGQGFLFPDHNSLVNPGQLSLSKDTGLQASYARQDLTVGPVTSTVQTATPSLAYANGRVGIGISASRIGTSLDSDNSSDIGTAAFGFALGKRTPVTIGATYTRTLDGNATNDGVVGAMVNLNPSKGEGFTIGVGGTMVLNSTSGPSTKTAIVGLGYSGRNRNNNIEANFSLPDIDDTSSYKVGGYATLGGQSYYIGAGYEYLKATSGDTSNLLGRAGFVLGRGSDVDFSVFINYQLEDGSKPLYGATLRVTF